MRMFSRRRSKLEKYIFSPNEIPGQLDNAKSVKFDGVDEYITVADFAGHRPSAISVSFWFKDPVGVGPPDYGSFVNKVDNDSWNGWNFYMNPAFGPKPLGIAWMANNYLGPTVEAPYAPLNDLGWHHVVGTASGTTSIIYVDGVAIASIALVGVGAVAYTLMIGCSKGGATFPGPPAYFVNCNIDEVSVWNVALTAADVRDLYNSKKPTNLLEHAKVANLVSWWRMGDDDTFPTIKDVVSARNGTITNGLAADIQNEVP